MSIEKVQESLEIPADLSYTSLEYASHKFLERYYLSPEILICSLEAFAIAVLMLDEIRKRGIYLKIDRSYSMYSWSLSKFDNSDKDKIKNLILYSAGS